MQSAEVAKAPVEAETAGSPPSPPKPATEAPAPASAPAPTPAPAPIETAPPVETETVEKVEEVKMVEKTDEETKVETNPVTSTLPQEEAAAEKEELEGEQATLEMGEDMQEEEPPAKRQRVSGGGSVRTSNGEQSVEERPRRQPQAHTGRSTQARPFNFRTQMRTGHRAGSVQSTLEKDLAECDKQFKSKGFSKRKVGKFGELGVKRTEAKKPTEFEEFSFMKREAAKRSKSQSGQMSPSELRRASIEARTLQVVAESPRSEHPLQKSADGGMAFRATPKPAFRESRVFRPRCSHRSTVPHPFKLRIDGRMGEETPKQERQEAKAKKPVTAFRSTSLSTGPMVKRL